MRRDGIIPSSQSPISSQQNVAQHDFAERYTHFEPSYLEPFLTFHSYDFSGSGYRW